MQARVVVFGKQVDNDVLYGGIADQPSLAYSSLYLYDFLSLFRIITFSYPRFEKVCVCGGGGDLSVVPFIHLSFCLSVLFCFL